MERNADIVAKDVIIKTIARLLIPFIQLFGLCVIIHGHATPGGGFQGGVILAASFILLALAYGLGEAKSRFALKIRLFMESSGGMIYALVGITCILAGGSFLQYSAVPLPFSPQTVSEILISVIEFGIGIAGMAVITTIFYTMAGGEQ